MACFDKNATFRLSRRQFIGSLSAASMMGIQGCVGPFQGNSRPLKAGVAKVQVTPPIQVPYLTSSANGTCQPFIGVHDYLYARAIVLDDGRSLVAILSVDAIGYDDAILGPGRNFTTELRTRVAARTDIRPEAIMVSSTHSHSTPETICLSNFRELDGMQQWLEQHLTSLVDAVVSAWTHRVFVKAFSGKTHVQGVARNRRIMLKDGKMSRHGPVPPLEQIGVPHAVDEELSFLYFERTNSRPHSVLLNFTAHPVIAMLLPQVSADYPGVAASRIEERFKGAVCLFTNGAAGNINTVAVSTNFDDVDRIGSTVADAAIRRIEEIRVQAPQADTKLGCLSTKVELTPRECPSVEQANAIVASDPSALNKRILRLALKLREQPLIAELQTMRIGPLKLITMPGEAFVETGLALKQAGAFAVVGYANGWLGYFPIERAYKEGSYEVELGAWSRVAPGSAEKLQAAGKALLNKFEI